MLPLRSSEPQKQETKGAVTLANHVVLKHTSAPKSGFSGWCERKLLPSFSTVGRGVFWAPGVHDA